MAEVNAMPTTIMFFFPPFPRNVTNAIQGKHRMVKSDGFGIKRECGCKDVGLMGNEL